MTQGGGQDQKTLSEYFGARPLSRVMEMKTSLARFSILLLGIFLPLAVLAGGGWGVGETQYLLDGGSFVLELKQAGAVKWKIVFDAPFGEGEVGKLRITQSVGNETFPGKNRDQLIKLLSITEKLLANYDPALRKKSFAQLPTKGERERWHQQLVLSCARRELRKLVPKGSGSAR